MKSEKRNSIQINALCVLVAFVSLLVTACYIDENRQLRSELQAKTERLKECEALYKVLADQHSKYIGSEACNTDNVLK